MHTKQNLNPFSVGIAIIQVSKNREIEGSLDEAKLGTIGSQCQFRVRSSSSLETCYSGLSCGRNGNGRVREVGCYGLPNGPVETVVVAEINVIAAQAAIVLDYWYSRISLMYALQSLSTTYSHGCLGHPG